MRFPITVNGQSQQWVRLDTGCATPLQWVTSRIRATACNPKVAIGLAELSIPQAQTIVEIVARNSTTSPPVSMNSPSSLAKPASSATASFPGFRVTIDAKSCRLILER